MKKITILLVLALFGLSANSQVTFQKTFGSLNTDAGNYVQQTTDGGYIVVGHTTNFPIAGSDKDVYLIKTDINGTLQWSKTYGGTDPQVATCVRQTTDGGYIVSGYDNSGTAIRGGFLIKTNSTGDTLWKRSFDGVYTTFNDVRQTTDGGYIVAASSYPNHLPYLIKTDNNGNLIWGNEYYPGSSTHGNLFSVQQTSDGNYIACGSCGISSSDIYLLKVNTAGNVLLSEIYSYPSGNSPTGNIILQTIDGGYILTAYYYNGITNVGLIIKLNASADIVWSKTYPAGVINSIQEIGNIGYVAITNLNYLLKIDTLGNFVSSRFYESLSGSLSLEHIQLTTDGGFIITGQMNNALGNNNDVYLIKTDMSGESNCNNIPYLMSPTNLTLTQSNVISTTISVVNIGGFFAYVNSPPTIENTLCTTVGVNNIADKNIISIYPNPVSGILNLEYQSNETERIEIEIINLLSQKVFSKLLQVGKGSNNITLEVEEIPSGVYLLQVKSKDSIFIKKIIKE